MSKRSRAPPAHACATLGAMTTAGRLGAVRHGAVRHVGILAPMRPELAPVVRRLELTDHGRGEGADGRIYGGRAGAVTITAMLTEIGMANAARAARAILEHGVDIVLVVGIAGSVDPRSAWAS